METLALLKQQVANARREFTGVMQDVTQEAGNWQPPGLANSIVDLYFHTVMGQDRTISRVSGKPALIEQWTTKLNVPTEFRHNPESSRALRADVATLKQYGDAVFGAVDAYLGSIKNDDLDRQLEGPRGPVPIVNTLSTMLVTHPCEHAGEISAMKGVQGFKGYATA